MYLSQTARNSHNVVIFTWLLFASGSSPKLGALYFDVGTVRKGRQMYSHLALAFSVFNWMILVLAFRVELLPGYQTMHGPDKL